MGFWWYRYLLLVYLVFVGLQASYSCPDEERSALLELKHSFILDCEVASNSPTAYPKVKSWGSGDHHGDCCLWDGVSCDAEIGHVIGLDLSSSCLYGNFPSNSSLFKLTRLQHLSLSDNHFNFSGIPSGVGQLTQLVNLTLSDSAFTGQIPLEISALSMLSVLDLSITDHGPKSESQLTLKDPSLEKLVQNLTRLTYLDLDYADISSSVPNLLTNFTLLKELSLPYCNLNGQFPTDILRLPHLENLYLDGNMDLVGFLPEFPQNSPITELSLQLTSFHGILPSSIGNLAELDYLNLYDCDLSGQVPSSLGNLTKLTTMDLRANFNGELPSSLTNLTQVQWLALADLSGRPDRLIFWLSKLNRLNRLGLYDINLGGEIPSVIANMTSLTWLDLVGNQLTGGLPPWLVNLTQLNFLSVSFNQLEGPISLPRISQLSKLHTLYLGGNRNLHGNLDDFLKLKSLRDLSLFDAKLTFLRKNASNESVAKLHYLKLQSCSLTEFPPSLQTQNELGLLDLSSNGIQGFVPQWFTNATKESLHLLNLSNNSLIGFEKNVTVLPWNHIEVLYLNSNQLQGPLPIPPTSTVVYQVSDNQLMEGIPRQICQASSMSYLDISNNHLGGQIPSCISRQLSTALSVLNLKDNNFHGTIPGSFPKSCSLKMVNLSGNQLKGILPRSLANCILEVLDIGRNHVDDTFPSWLGGLPKLQVLVLRHNNFHGRIGVPKPGLEFRSLRIIDLSNNFLTGDLPFAYVQHWDAMKVTNESQPEISGTTVTVYIKTSDLVDVKSAEYDYQITITNKGNDMEYTKVLTVFRVIDFSSNNFTGKIPFSIGELRGLQAMNLSNNNLVGGIPPSLADITDLESLDLSNNMLSGHIPTEFTRLTFLEVFNVSYNELSGPIPQGNQLTARDNSSFVANLGLCGEPLSKKCGDVAVQPPPPDVMESDADEKDSKLIDWMIRSLGCVSGFAVGFALGKLYITDRNHEWFVETFGRKRRTPRSSRTSAARRRS